MAPWAVYYSKRASDDGGVVVTMSAKVQTSDAKRAIDTVEKLKRLPDE
jgi:Mrp family chromosome partitioning ATPase